MEDSLMIYSGGEHKDITAINPDAVVWSHVQVRSFVLWATYGI